MRLIVLVLVASLMLTITPTALAGSVDDPQTAYYRVTLTQELTNPSAEASEDVWLDVILFSHRDWQFAALAWSSVPLKTMYVDGENNWHGVFDIGTIQAGTSRTVLIEVIFACDNYESGASEANTGLITEVPAELEPYLRADNYWEVDSTEIQEKKQEVVGDETNAYLVAKKIMEFVAENIEYENVALRQGALQTLLTGKGDCDGFSDLTIALSRAAGLPARICFGWAYQEEEEEFGGHAWVEFYLPNHDWQPADPTWAKVLGGYLGELPDRAHLLRSTWGLTSMASNVWVTYYGGRPEIQEDESLEKLRPAQATGELFTAARVAVDLADRLFEANGNENLRQELELAHTYLEQARVASPPDKISLAQKAVTHANVVIRALGSPPERPIRLPEWLIWFCVAVVAIGVATIVGLKLHSRNKLIKGPVR